jgi:hypothetical protein
MVKSSIESELESELRNRKFYSKFDFLMHNLLVLIAVLASAFPAFNEIFHFYESNIIAAIAAAPAFILLLQKTFKWEQRADWHWEYKRKVKSIQRQLRDQGITTAQASKLLSQLEHELASTFPGTSYPGAQD